MVMSPPRRLPADPPPPHQGPTREGPPGTFRISRGIARRSWKLGLYGPEGVGKSSLMASCPGIVVADLEHSTLDLDVARVEGLRGWDDLRAWVQSVRTGVIGIDSMTRAEDWCVKAVIANKGAKVKKPNAPAIDSIEDFDYGKGGQFVCDEFRRFLADIEAAFLRGVSIVMVAHDRVSRIKNPDDADFMRHEPRLFDSPKASNMLQWVQFLDHLGFIDLDKDVNKSGKAEGNGRRGIYFSTAPTRLSKTRSLPVDFLPYPKGDTTLWGLLEVKA